MNGKMMKVYYKLLRRLRKDCTVAYEAHKHFKE